MEVGVADATAPLLISPTRCPPDGVTSEPSPWADIQVVEVDRGRPLHLRGCESLGESLVRYRYDGESPVAGLHLIEYAIWEGGGWLLVDNVSGREFYLDGRPIFSPDRAWMATTGLDLEANYFRNHVDVWSVQADSVRRALALEGRDQWGATNARWASDDTLTFQLVTWLEEPAPPLYLDTVPAIVFRDASGSWMSSFAR